VLSIISTGQAQRLDPDLEALRDEIGGLDLVWSKGSVMLNDGTELHGKLKYNEYDNVISFDSGDNLRQFTAKTCVGFEFFDVDQQKQRMYVSLDYSFDGKVPVPVLFGAMLELKSLAVLRRASLNVTLKVSTGDSEISDRPKRLQYTQRWEVIYLMSGPGEIKELAYFVMKDHRRDLWDKESAEVVGLEFLKELIGQAAFDDLEKYQEENKLSFKDRGELLLIFDYYQERWADK